MIEFDFELEQTPWELTLSALRKGDSLSAVRFLTLLEGEDEEAWENAFLDLEEKHIALTVDELPADYGTGDMENRLRREEMLVGTGNLLENLDEDDPLRMYLEEIASIPTAEDVDLLAAKVLAGDESASQRLLNATISAAVAAAQGMTGRGVLLLDLMQEASLGLWQAILRYEGGDFETHADWWIQLYLARAVVSQAREGGVGRKMKKALEDYRNADRQLLTQLGRNPTMEEIALELGITAQEAEVYQDMLQNARSMEWVRKPPKEPEPDDDQAVEDTAYFQSRQRILEMLSSLTAQEARVLTLRFGLEGGQVCTPQQAAEKMNITADQVVQLEAAALEKLRKDR